MKYLFIIILFALLSPYVCPMLRADTTAYIPDSGGNKVKRFFVSDENNWVNQTVCVDENAPDNQGGPYGAAVTPTGDYLVVTCHETDKVAVITTKNFEDNNDDSVTTIVLSNQNNENDDAIGPQGVAIETRGQKAYVANYDNNTVYEIDIKSAQRTATFQVGTNPRGVAATYNDEDNTEKIYVSNYSDNTISVIVGNKVETFSDVGNAPIGVALSPNGDRLYVANNGSNTVSIIDTKNLSLEAIIDVGRKPWGVAVADDGGAVFVTNREDGTVSIINTVSNTVSGTYKVGESPMGVAAPINGEFAYVVNDESKNISKVTIFGDVTTIDGNGEELANVFALGAFVGGDAPSNPTDLEVEINEDHSDEIILTWQDNSDNELGFKIERKEEEIEEDEEEDNNNDNNNNNTDHIDDNDNTDNGNDNNEDSDNNNSGGIVTPLNTRASSESPRKTSTTSLRSANSGNSYVQIAIVGKNTTTYTDKNLSSKKLKYHYRIRAFTEAANSDYSNSESITTEGEKFSWCFIGTLLN